MRGSAYFKNVVFFNGRGLFITYLEGGTISNISFANTNFVNSTSVYPFISVISYTTNPITISDINVDFGELANTNIHYNVLFKNVTDYNSGDGLFTLKNITLKGTYNTNNNNDLSFYVFEKIPYVSIENVDINYHLQHNYTSSYYGYRLTLFNKLGTIDDYRFNNISDSHGVEKFKNVNINLTSNRIETYFGSKLYLRENAIAENVSINVDSTQNFTAGDIFRDLKLSRNSGFKNFDVNIVGNGDTKLLSFAHYVEYDARTENVGDIIFENLNTRGKYFIGWLRAIDNHTPSSPSAMQKIKFSKLDIKGPLIHIWDVKGAGSFSDLTTPAIEVENTKIHSEHGQTCFYGSCSPAPTIDAPIISGVTNYSSTDYRYTNALPALTSSSDWLTPNIEPSVKLTNILVIPLSGGIGVHPNIVSQAADSGDTVVNATKKAICDTSGSSGNFYTNQIVGISDNSAHTSCNTLTSESDGNLQDSSSGNVYETAGWDFTNVWKWPDGGGYPELR